MTLQEIADRLECRLEGDGSIDITGIAAIEDAEPGQLTFFTNPKYAPALLGTRASAVIAGDQTVESPCAILRCAILRAREPYLTFARAVELFADPWRPPAGVHALALVEADAIVSADASIGPFAVVGQGARIGARTIVHPQVSIGRFAKIGDDCVIHAQTSIRERVRIGDRVIIQDGAVIGADGYGFARRQDGSHHKIPQVGGVVIEDDVEIGANTTVDRPAVGQTRIAAGTKIDNLVQVAHGVRIGRNVLLAAQVGVAGSSVVEDQVTLAGQVGVAGHIRIGKGTIATAQTGIPNSVDPGSFVSGYPAIPNRDWLKASALFRKLPELRKLVSDLERRIAELEAERNK
nr:lipid_A_lpxD: UDP-3-O-[3-hydroxymyristoyl] glucosamine [uncultured bacterium]